MDREISTCSTRSTATAGVAPSSDENEGTKVRPACTIVDSSYPDDARSLSDFDSVKIEDIPDAGKHASTRKLLGLLSPEPYFQVTDLQGGNNPSHGKRDTTQVGSGPESVTNNNHLAEFGVVNIISRFPSELTVSRPTRAAFTSGSLQASGKLVGLLARLASCQILLNLAPFGDDSQFRKFVYDVEQLDYEEAFKRAHNLLKSYTQGQDRPSSVIKILVHLGWAKEWKQVSLPAFRGTIDEASTLATRAAQVAFALFDLATLQPSYITDISKGKLPSAFIDAALVTFKKTNGLVFSPTSSWFFCEAETTSEILQYLPGVPQYVVGGNWMVVLFALCRAVTKLNNVVSAPVEAALIALRDKAHYESDIVTRFDFKTTLSDLLVDHHLDANFLSVESGVVNNRVEKYIRLGLTPAAKISLGLNASNPVETLSTYDRIRAKLAYFFATADSAVRDAIKTVKQRTARPPAPVEETATPEKEPDKKFDIMFMIELLKKGKSKLKTVLAPVYQGFKLLTKDTSQIVVLTTHLSICERLTGKYMKLTKILVLGLVKLVMLGVPDFPAVVEDDETGELKDSITPGKVIRMIKAFIDIACIVTKYAVKLLPSLRSLNKLKYVMKGDDFKEAIDQAFLQLRKTRDLKMPDKTWDDDTPVKDEKRLRAVYDKRAENYRSACWEAMCEVISSAVVLAADGLNTFLTFHDSRYVCETLNLVRGRVTDTNRPAIIDKGGERIIYIPYTPESGDAWSGAYKSSHKSGKGRKRRKHGVGYVKRGKIGARRKGWNFMPQAEYDKLSESQKEDLKKNYRIFQAGEDMILEDEKDPEYTDEDDTPYSEDDEFDYYDDGWDGDPESKSYGKVIDQPLGRRALKRLGRVDLEGKVTIIPDQPPKKFVEGVDDIPLSTPESQVEYKPQAILRVGTEMPNTADLLDRLRKTDHYLVKVTCDNHESTGVGTLVDLPVLPKGLKTANNEIVRCLAFNLHLFSAANRKYDAVSARDWRDIKPDCKMISLFKVEADGRTVQIPLGEQAQLCYADCHCDCCFDPKSKRGKRTDIMLLFHPKLKHGKGFPICREPDKSWFGVSRAETDKSFVATYITSRRMIPQACQSMHVTNFCTARDAGSSGSPIYSFDNDKMHVSGISLGKYQSETLVLGFKYLNFEALPDCIGSHPKPLGQEGDHSTAK